MQIELINRKEKFRNGKKLQTNTFLLILIPLILARSPL